MWAMVFGSVPPVQWQDTDDDAHYDSSDRSVLSLALLYALNSAYASLEMQFFWRASSVEKRFFVCGFIVWIVKKISPETEMLRLVA